MITTIMYTASSPDAVWVLLGALFVVLAAIIAGLRVKLRSLRAALAQSRQLPALTIERLNLGSGRRR